MTVSQLIKELERVENQNALVVLGVEGYTTLEDGAPQSISVAETEKGVFIVDGCFYEEVDG